MDDVVDFRFRPVGAQSWSRDTTFHYLGRMFLEPCPSFAQQSAELMLAEMDAAGIAGRAYLHDNAASLLER